MGEIDPCASCNQPDKPFTCEFCTLPEVTVAHIKPMKLPTPMDEVCEREVTKEEYEKMTPKLYTQISDPKSTKYIEVMGQAIELHARKNSNYAGFVEGDPYANFRQCENFDVAAWLGVLVRMSDKWSRIMTLAKGVPDQVGESFEDTLIDIINYAAICVCLYREGKYGNK